MAFSKKTTPPTPLHPLHSIELFKIFFLLLTLSTAFLQKACGPGKNNIKKIEDISKINICILRADEKENVYPMFTSENKHKSDLNLFYYMNHICLIKDINKYLYRNNKHKNKKYFCVRCLNSFNSEQNLTKHKDLCVKYNTKSEKLILPKEDSILKFNKINEMIRTPFTVYYDIETYGKYLKKQKKIIQNTTHEQLLKPYLIGYILENNYDDKFLKNAKFLQVINV